MRVCVCACACVRACVRAWVRACVYARILFCIILISGSCVYIFLICHVIFRQRAFRTCILFIVLVVCVGSFDRLLKTLRITDNTVFNKTAVEFIIYDENDTFD